ncbi:SH3 domain-containing protein [Jimgerdemannia flammicorona]|uniref:SH3 domain-containing protein n=1 Tax=Jimgerdemannia flammicorona TaxID=994334 RepID=A0A433PWS7_9FUNG|nr:SH3 domain-containing protein [Jimgerdemannia flammicorona]
MKKKKNHWPYFLTPFLQYFISLLLPVLTRSSATSRTIYIRDFAHPNTSPLHYGLPPSPSTPTSSQRSSRALSEASDFTGRQARALYDFDAENPSECSFREGELIWVQYRQCPGWLVADVGDETGLVPENYVEILEEVELAVALAAAVKAGVVGGGKEAVLKA